MSRTLETDFFLEWQCRKNERGEADVAVSASCFNIYNENLRSKGRGFRGSISGLVLPTNLPDNHVLIEVSPSKNMFQKPNNTYDGIKASHTLIICWLQHMQQVL